MKLASQAAEDFNNGISIEYLKTWDDTTDIVISRTKCFSQKLFEYITEHDELFSKEEAHDRVTRSEPFTVEEARVVSDRYTDLLWTAVNKRLEFTDMSDTPCAFSEAPAEGIFSIYSRVSQGRASATIQHLTGLTRVAAHGPPVATEAAVSLAADALKNFKSKFGERFCTRSWGRGKTSTTIGSLKAKKWDW